MPNIDSLKFDLTKCEQVDRSAEQKVWINHEDGVAHLLKFYSEPVEWQFDLTNIEGPRKFYGEQCASVGGAMLSMDILNVNNMEVLRGVFKYRSPVPQSLAMMTVGILWIPFSNITYQLNVESLERGTTGMREAAVQMLDPSEYPDPTVLERCPWPQMDPEAEPIVVNSAEEMFERMRQTKLRALPSDDQQFDEMFPHHPLSLVRSRLNVIIDTLKIDKMMWESLKPFRFRGN